MLNYVVDPRLITPLVPAETEIDFENGETFLSVVGFLFLDTRLLGLPIPLHRDFEEVNLRFYVRRKSADTWRRGVVFIRELVPRRAIALVARTFYGENYVAVPMKHEIEHLDEQFEGGILVAPRPQMGITQNDGDWRSAIYSSRIARRIYHRTLLGLHRVARRLQRIPRRTSALEDLERDELRTQRRRCDSLRRAIRRSVKSAAALRIHCGRLTDYRPKTPDSSVVAVCLGAVALA